MSERRAPTWVTNGVWGFCGSCAGMIFMAILLRLAASVGDSPAASDPTSVKQLILVGAWFGFVGGLLARQNWRARP
jgi:hypothetical protein